MPSKKIQISIPKPCSEDWSNMTPTERGRFCAMCTKEVVDFTGLTDQELVSTLMKFGESTCGRVRQTQLEKEFMLVSEQSSSRTKRFWNERIFASSMLALSLGSSKAQSPVAGIPISENLIVNESMLKDNEHIDSRDFNPNQHKISLSGVILDSLTNEPIAFAKVLLDAYSKGVITDYEGKFELSFIVDEMPDSIELIINAHGFGGKTITLQKVDFEKPVQIYLAASETAATVEIIVGRTAVVGAMQLELIKPETKSQRFWRRMKFWKRRK